jgi:hypothetical protein
MTRRKTPQPLAFAWRPGEPGEIVRASLVVPRALRQRYKAVVEFVEPPDNTAEVRGDRVTLPAKGTTESVGRLWADALTIARDANPRGRPRGSDVTEERIHAAVALLRKKDRKVSLVAIANVSGAFTYDQLRYYLKANGRKLTHYR